MIPLLKRAATPRCLENESENYSTSSERYGKKITI